MWKPCRHDLKIKVNTQHSYYPLFIQTNDIPVRLTKIRSHHNIRQLAEQPSTAVCITFSEGFDHKSIPEKCRHLFTVNRVFILLISRLGPLRPVADFRGVRGDMSPGPEGLGALFRPISRKKICGTARSARGDAQARWCAVIHERTIFFEWPFRPSEPTNAITFEVKRAQGPHFLCRKLHHAS
jgi:hypothetical protein